MSSLVNLYKKNKSVILYLVFGVATTVVNIISYYLFYEILRISNLISTVIAWFFSVLFAYITNKKYVFESKVLGIKEWLREIIAFFSCRIATGVMDAIIMVITVDYLQQNSMFWKIISNVLVIIVNYIASKYLIFKR